jgi:molybdate transport system substrate-binding protein
MPSPRSGGVSRPFLHHRPPRPKPKPEPGRTAGLRYRLGIGFLVALASIVVGCSSDDETASPGTDPAAHGLTGTLSVYAASSLTAVSASLSARFEELNPGVTVELTFNGSSALVTQITEGAPADVLATADTASMARAVDAGLTVGPATVFAGNRLSIVVGAGNPLGVFDLADLARDDVVTVLCASDVPCGRYAEAALASAGVTVEPRSRELNVKAVVSRVSLGEADAGIVYVTDVVADDMVEGVAIAEAHNVEAEYPVAVLSDSDQTPLAEAFVDFLLSDEAQARLTAAGFLAAT